MSLQSAELAGVLEINRDEAEEISVAGAAGADAVPVAEPADAVHTAVVDEVEADGAAWPEIQDLEWVMCMFIQRFSAISVIDCNSLFGFVTKPGAPTGIDNKRCAIDMAIVRGCLRRMEVTLR